MRRRWKRCKCWVRVYVRNHIWAYRVRQCWRQAEGDYGQFLSNIGFCRAYRTLPHDILRRAGFDKDES